MGKGKNDCNQFNAGSGGGGSLFVTKTIILRRSSQLWAEVLVDNKVPLTRAMVQPVKDGTSSNGVDEALGGNNGNGGEACGQGSNHYHGGAAGGGWLTDGEDYCSVGWGQGSSYERAEAAMPLSLVDKVEMQPKLRK